MSKSANSINKMIKSNTGYAVKRLCAQGGKRLSCTKSIEALIRSQMPHKPQHFAPWAKRFFQPMVRFVERRCRKETLNARHYQTCTMNHVIGRRVLLNKVSDVHTNRPIRFTFARHLQCGVEILNGRYPCVIIDLNVKVTTVRPKTKTKITKSVTKTK